MGKVVKLRPHQPELLQTTAAFEAAWKAYPEEGRKRQSRRESFPDWQVAAMDVGEPRLLQSVHAYAAACRRGIVDGRPGFGRWLKWGRYENWVSEEVAPQKRLDAPKGYRERFVALLGEEFVVSWIDQCVWVSDRLLAPRQFTVEKLRAKFLQESIRVLVDLNGPLS